MINFKALIVGFTTVVFAIIMAYIKIKDRSSNKKKIKERKEGSKQRFKKKK